MKFLEIFLLVINIVSFIGVVIFSVLGIYDAIMGPGCTEKLLKQISNHFSYKRILIAGIICLAVMFVSYILREKLFGK